MLAWLQGMGVANIFPQGYDNPTFFFAEAYSSNIETESDRKGKQIGCQVAFHLPCHTVSIIPSCEDKERRTRVSGKNATIVFSHLKYSKILKIDSLCCPHVSKFPMSTTVPTAYNNNYCSYASGMAGFNNGTPQISAITTSKGRGCAVHPKGFSQNERWWMGPVIMEM